MSLNATLMCASKRTYPEISFPVVYLASKSNKATEDDYGKAMSVIGSHACLVLPVLTGCGLSRSHTQWLVAYTPGGLVAEVYGRVASPSRMHNSTNYNKWSS